MDIDEWVQESLDPGPKPKSEPDSCALGCGNLFHGRPKGPCPGPFEIDPEKVQNQGVIDWSEHDYGYN